MFLIDGSGLLLHLLLARYADPETRATLFLEYEAYCKDRESPKVPEGQMPYQQIEWEWGQREYTGGVSTERSEVDLQDIVNSYILDSWKIAASSILMVNQGSLHISLRFSTYRILGSMLSWIPCDLL